MRPNMLRNPEVLPTNYEVKGKSLNLLRLILIRMAEGELELQEIATPLTRHDK